MCDSAKGEHSWNSRSSSLQMRILRSIHQIDAAQWDAILKPEDLFHSHRFIQTVEDAGVEDSQFWYLLFYQQERLIGTAVLSAFTVSLDMFVTGLLKKIILVIRQRFARFLHINVLFCGLPVSLGQRNLVVAKDACYAEIISLLTAQMKRISRLQGIYFQCAKEFFGRDSHLTEHFARHGFIRVNSIPYVIMPLCWKSFQDYLASLRHAYRRPIVRSLRKIGCRLPQIFHTVPQSPQDHPVVIIGSRELCPAKTFYQLYRQVMVRARVKLEVLNQAFFDNLYENMWRDMELLLMVENNTVLGAALLTIRQKIMTFALLGLDYERRDEYHVYFNLLYAIIARAIDCGCNQLFLGQTSYWLKQRIGGICMPEIFYLRAENLLIHTFLRVFRSLIFPEIVLPNPRVFRRQSVKQKKTEDGK